MAASLVARGRNRALGVLGRSDRVRTAIVGSAVRVASRLGAHPAVLAEARREGRPLDRSLQIVQWSLAASGHGSFPRRFWPGDHLVDPGARAAAAELVRALDDAPPEIARQLIGLEDAAGLDGTLRSIETDLRTQIAAVSTRPKRGAGVDGSLQTAVIAEMQTVLATCGERPFLMSGTLLGIIRDGRFMAHDHDVDLGLLPGADVDTVLTAIDGSDGFRPELLGGRIAARHTSGVTVDVFPHEHREGRFWHGTRIHEWWNTPFELVARDVDGVVMWIPDDPQRYLTENYGDWSTPVPFYDISFDTPNRRYLHDLDTVRFLHSRCVQALERGDRWLLESAARELRDEFGVDVTDLLADSPLLS